MRKDLCRRVIQQDVSVIHDNNTVSLCGLFHIMRNQNYGNAVIPVQHPNGFHHFHAPLRVKHCRRLVQDDTRRTHGNDAGNGDTLFLSAGQLIRCVHPIFIHSNRFQGIVHPFPNRFRRQPQIFRSERHIFLHDRCNDLVVRILKHHAHVLSDVVQLFFIAGVHAGDPHLAAGGQQNCVHMLCQRGLSAAIMPQDRHKRTGLKSQRQIFQNLR